MQVVIEKVLAPVPGQALHVYIGAVHHVEDREGPSLRGVVLGRFGPNQTCARASAVGWSLGVLIVRVFMRDLAACLFCVCRLCSPIWVYSACLTPFLESRDKKLSHNFKIRAQSRTCCAYQVHLLRLRSHVVRPSHKRSPNKHAFFAVGPHDIFHLGVLLCAGISSIMLRQNDGSWCMNPDPLVGLVD